MNKPLKIFITYAHKNKEAKDKLIECLAVMKSDGVISIWHDNEILPGDKWREEIFSTHLPDSDILLYLVSRASLASENCNKELAGALSFKIRVIPIILESCDWLNHQLSDFQALPNEGLPINQWDHEDEGWQNVVDGIRKVVDKMQSQTDSTSGIFEDELLAELVFQQGNVFMMFGQIDRAIECYSSVIDLKPDYAEAYNNRGVSYQERGEHDLAIADFNTVIELNPDDAHSYVNRGTAYKDKGDYNHAIKDHNRAIQLQPNFAGAYNNRGNAYRNKGNFARAIEDFNKAIELNPNDAGVYGNRGDAYRNKGNFACAIDDYTKAIELNPDLAGIYNNRGAAYSEQGLVARAIEDFNKAIELNPNYTEAHNNRGAAYGSKGNFARAIKDLNKAIELNPNYTEAYNNRGNAYAKKGDYDRAIEDYTRTIELNPNYAMAYSNRGNAYSDKGDYDRAIEDCNTAIDLKPDDAKAYSNRGIAYRNKGKVDRAIKDYTKAIELNPNFAEAYANRGIAYGKKGDFDRAIADCTKAIQLNPNDANAYNNRGAAYTNTEEFDKAIIDYTKAIDLNPNHGIAYNNRGRVWLHLREWEEVKSDLTAARDLGMDIIALFHNEYKNVEAYERANRVKLPEDIALMLTQRRRSRFPKTEKFLSADGTPLESPDVLNLLAKLRNSGPPLSQYVQTRPAFGIKTGASGAFVVDSATRDQLIAEHPASADILKPFLHGRDIRRWEVKKPVDKSRSIGDTWLIFAHRRIEINRYPAIRKHLEQYRPVLSKRAGKQKWYELPTTKRGIELFTQTKLICPNNYDHQTFAVDTEGFYCGDTCYMIPTEETWLCGLLNSRAVEWFYSQVSKQLTGDYLQARSRHIQEIPIPDLTSTQKSLIGKIVDYLIYLQGQPTTSGGDLAHARDAVMLGYFERIIDGLAYESYLSEELHQGDKQFFNPLFDERLPQLEEIRGDKMAALREIFECLYERTHPIRRNLFFLNSVKPIRIIEDRT